MAEKRDIENGFINFASHLLKICEAALDKDLQKQNLETGAKPILNRAKTNARGLNKTRRRNGARQPGNLARSIHYEYQEKTDRGVIGIGSPVSTTNSSTGFYGRFQEQGFRPRKGRRKADATLDKRSNKRGRRVRNPFIDPAVNFGLSKSYEIRYKHLERELAKIK